MQWRALGRNLVPFLAALLLTATGFAFGRWFYTIEARSRHLNFALLAEADQALRDHYVSALPSDTSLTYGMIRGMLQAVGDPYTTFVEPASHELEEDTFSGEYGGVGAEIRQDAKGGIHLIPFEGGPADRAGIVEGDLLIEVDAWDVSQATRMEEVAAALRGPVGSQVQVKIRQGSGAGEVVSLEMTRESFPLPSVTSYVSPDEKSIGVIAISLFTDRTREEITQAYDQLMQREVRAFVLDLRNNPGGLLDASVQVAGFFQGPGIVLIEQFRDQEQLLQPVEESAIAASVPLAVLVDGTTASAAEVLAGALQASGRAPLIGSRTVGKGSVQVMVELSDGSSLHITRARWLTPARAVIDGKGLTPDIDVQPGQSEPDSAMRTATEWLLEGGDAGP